MSLITSNWLIDVLLLIVFAYIILYKYVTRKFDYWKIRNVPFIKPHAFYGNFKEVSLFKCIAGEHLQYMYDQMKGHRYFGIFVIDKPVLVLRDPELVKRVLVKDFHQFVNRTTNVMQENQPIFGNLPFFSKDETWKTIRPQITRAFTTGKLKQIVPLMMEICDDMKNYLIKHSSDGIVEAKEVCTKYTVDVVASYAFGIKANSFKKEDAIFLKMCHKLFGFDTVNATRQLLSFFAPELANFFKIKVVGQDVTNYLTDTLLQTLTEREKSQYKRNDIIDLIIDMKKNPKFCKEFEFGKNKQ